MYCKVGPYCKVGRYWNINSIINSFQAPESTAVLLPARPSYVLLMISVHATPDTHSCHASSRYLTVRSCPHLRSVNCTHLQPQNLLLKILPGIPVLSSFVMLFVKFLTWVMSVSVWIVHCCQLHDTDGSSDIPPEVADDLYGRSMHASFVQPVCQNV